MWRGKVLLQERARKLRSQGRSVKEIARLLKVSKSSVSVWVRGIKLSSTQALRLLEREQVGGAKGRKTLALYWDRYHREHPKIQNFQRWPKRRVEDFFDTWSPEMAYVLGYFAADGCMYRNKRGSYYIGFTSTDRELIEIVKRLMGATNIIEEYQSPIAHHKRRYTLQIGSKKIYQRLTEFGFTPAKSLCIEMPNVPDHLLCHFFRGYFDGDGCIYFNRLRRNDSGNSHTLLMARFTCGSKKFLEALQCKLSEVANMGLGSLHPHTSAWDLSYSIQAARQLYYFMYPTSTVPCLKRKRDTFEQGLALFGPVV